MKRITPLLAVMLLLSACHKHLADRDKIYEGWMYCDALRQVPRLPARSDSTLLEINPSTPKWWTKNESIPQFAGDVTILPLAPTPGFHIGYVEMIEADGNLLFVLGAETEDNGEDVFQYKIKRKAAFIFHKNGSLVARLKDVSKDRDNLTMVVNREAKEVCLMCWEKNDNIADLLSYDYEGNLLRHEETFFDYGNIMGFTQNHLVANVRPPLSGFAPQLTVYDQELLPDGFCLSRPSETYTRDREAALVSSGDELFYAAGYSDTIWKVTPDGALARYLVRDDSLGIGSVAFDSTLTQSGRVLATENIFIPNAGISPSLLVSPGFLVRRYIQRYNIKIEEESDSIFRWTSNNHNTFLVYDRISGHSCWAWSINPNKCELQGLCLISSQALAADGTLISFHTPAQLKYYASHPEWYQLDDKTLTFIRQLDIKANPVLLLMPLKHF